MNELSTDVSHGSLTAAIVAVVKPADEFAFAMGSAKRRGMVRTMSSGSSSAPSKRSLTVAMPQTAPDSGLRAIAEKLHPGSSTSPRRGARPASCQQPSLSDYGVLEHLIGLK